MMVENASRIIPHKIKFAGSNLATGSKAMVSGKTSDRSKMIYSTVNWTPVFIFPSHRALASSPFRLKFMRWSMLIISLAKTITSAHHRNSPNI